ncbi:G1 family glutamic endopeptidase [Actinospica robiniae]|uniref:G1 family glutamic endopeptidase n=1 Tax=Actinospica robiniae TaxID=304901 RepID=UPI000422D0A4|nr:G1 family glutamic endopeptidase [Actinospica robiniae]
MIRNRSLTALGVAAVALGLTAAAGPAFAAAPAAKAGASFNPGGLFRPAAGAHPNAARAAAGKTVLDYSTNWPGYAVTGAAFTSASATWVQNAATCSSSGGETDMSPWVGLDGFSDSTVEQIGTSADCSGSSVDYYAWYEMYPANYVTINKTIKKGDSFTGTVTHTSGTTYKLTLVNNTEGWTYSVSKSLSAGNSSAEAVMEQAGDHLTKWTGTDPFTSFTVNGSPAGSFTGSQYTIYQMEIQNGSTLCDSDSALSGNENFTTTWLNAC